MLGYLGVLLGKLIKAAVSRQREFLADASSVQFTRNPGGIAGALKKIGGLADGSRISDAHAEEASHMFFGDALAGSFFNMLATHPPLAERIRALDPTSTAASPRSRWSRTTTPRKLGNRGRNCPSPFPPRCLATAGAVMGLDAGRMVDQIGRPQTEHLDHAGQIVGGLPPTLLDCRPGAVFRPGGRLSRCS